MNYAKKDCHKREETSPNEKKAGGGGGSQVEYYRFMTLPRFVQPRPLIHLTPIRFDPATYPSGFVRTFLDAKIALPTSV